MSDSLWPHRLQHARIPCPSLYLKSLLKLMSIESVIPPTISSPVTQFSSYSQPFPASESFPMVGFSHQVAKVLELQYKSFQWIFRFELLVVQGTFKILLQHHSSKESILQWSAFFIVQLSYLYMTTGKTLALTIWTFVSEVVSLLFNILSRFVIALLPRS